MVLKNQIEIRGLSAGYPMPMRMGTSWRIVISSVSFSLDGGTISAIVGSNARGKSTLIRAMIDATARTEGEVLIDGEPLKASQIAYVPQNPALTLSPWSTVLDDVAAPLRMHGVDRKTSRDQAMKTIAELGVTLPPERSVQSLSGGQRVLVAVARALTLREARLLVLDEAFEGLDGQSRCLLLRMLEQVRDRGITVLLTSHRRDDLLFLGARLLRLDGVPVTQIIEEAAAQSPQVETQRVDDRSFARASDELETSPRQRRSVDLRGLLQSAVGVLGGLAIWYAVARWIGNRGILPTPVDIARELVNVFGTYERVQHMSATLLRAAVAWVVSMMLAVPLGILIGANATVFRLLAPWLSLGRCIPIFTLGGAAIGLLPGQPELQRFLLIASTLFLIALQIISLATAVAPRRRWDYARITGASLAYRLHRILFREAMGGVISALEVTLPTAIIVVFVVETTLLPNVGLGAYLLNHLTDSDLSRLYAYILIPGMIAAAGVWIIRSSTSKLRREL